MKAGRSKIRKENAMCRCLLLAIFAATAGCAAVHVRPLTADEHMKKASAEGVRFYRPWPYLLVTAETSDKGTNYKGQILYLPKMDDEYIVQVKNGWGTANGSVKLQDGWMLNEQGTIVDSKIPETITAISGLITAAGGVAAANV